jgi:type I site-specific restriction endonuclease
MRWALRRISEEKTREEMIDPQLERAGWYLRDHSRVKTKAIRRVGEAFANGKRKALIVMATGTGKTRTTMGLIDVFMRSNQARRSVNVRVEQ